MHAAHALLHLEHVRRQVAAVHQDARAGILQHVRGLVVHAGGEAIRARHLLLDLTNRRQVLVELRELTPGQSHAEGVALEALRDTWRSRRATMDQLTRFARPEFCRLAD